MNKVMKTKAFFISAMIMASVMVTACGGGGGSSSSPAMGNSGSTANSPVSTIVTSVPAATYPASSYAAAIYTQLNSFRSNVGSGLLTQNTDLDTASAAHLNYLALNGVVDPSFHIEAGGQAGFTGVDPQTRALVAGYLGQAGEVGYSQLQAGAETNCVMAWADSVYHMAAILGSQRDVGVAAGDNTLVSNPSITAATCVSDYGIQSGATGQYPAPGAVLAYPFNGQTGVPTSFNNQAEEPIPVSDLNGVGQPVGVNLNSPVFTVNSFTLTNAGTAVPSRILANSSVIGTGVVTDSNVEPGYAYLVPISVLLPNTTYSVTFTAIVSATSTTPAVSYAKTWTFTTGAVVSY